MSTKRMLVAATLVALAFAGCTGEPEPRVVDFSNVDATQPRGTFHLHIKVVGLENATTHALEGAFVGAASGDQAIAKSTTNPNGESVLLLRDDQTIKIVAKADGWTTEDSGSIRIGGGSSATSGGASCGVFVEGAWCVADDSSNYTTSGLHLTGTEGSISVVLFRKVVEQTFTIPVSAHAGTPVGPSVAAPDNKRWFPASAQLSKDPDLHRLYMDRLVETHSTLKWTNGMLNQADFELGVGCVRDAPQKLTSNTAPAVTKQGANELKIDWNPVAKNAWSGCGSVFVGPYTDSVNGDVSANVVLDLVFHGKSTIIPLNT